MKGLRILVIGFSFLYLSFGSPTTATAANGTGGSWFLWYANDGTYNHTCYGVVRNYNKSAAQATIKANLQTMYNNGQRRLGIGGWFGRGHGADPSCPSTDTGSSFDSNNSSDKTQFMQNLYDLINYAQNTIGFAEVLVAVGPLSWTGTGAFYNDPGYAGSAYSTYASWKSAYFSENYGVIQSLRSKLAGGSFFYKLILMDEAFWNNGGLNMTYRANYFNDLWSQYYTDYGHDVNYSGTTIAASVSEAETDSELAGLETAALNAGSGAPYLYFLNSFTNETNQVIYADNYLTNYYGDSTSGFVISSSNYNNSTSASNFHTAENYRTIHYLLQWPQEGTNDLVQAYNNYLAYGF